MNGKSIVATVLCAVFVLAAGSAGAEEIAKDISFGDFITEIGTWEYDARFIVGRLESCSKKYAVALTDYEIAGFPAELDEQFFPLAGQVVVALGEIRKIRKHVGRLEGVPGGDRTNDMALNVFRIKDASAVEVSSFTSPAMVKVGESFVVVEKIKNPFSEPVELNLALNTESPFPFKLEGYNGFTAVIEAGESKTFEWKMKAVKPADTELQLTIWGRGRTKQSWILLSEKSSVRTR
jgi:hypothetical protein